jgi:hypothetical protein
LSLQRSGAPTEDRGNQEKLRPLISDVDLLQENSLDLPATTKLASQLGPHGVAPWLVTIEELEAALEQIVERPDGH